jgi:hypothetical protein
MHNVSKSGETIPNLDYIPKPKPIAQKTPMTIIFFKIMIFACSLQCLYFRTHTYEGIQLDKLTILVGLVAWGACKYWLFLRYWGFGQSWLHWPYIKGWFVDNLNLYQTTLHKVGQQMFWSLQELSLGQHWEQHIGFTIVLYSSFCISHTHLWLGSPDGYWGLMHHCEIYYK